jgi:hypothetical protein
MENLSTESRHNELTITAPHSFKLSLLPIVALEPLFDFYMLNKIAR